jgi:hypothetical protein
VGRYSSDRFERADRNPDRYRSSDGYAHCHTHLYAYAYCFTYTNAYEYSIIRVNLLIAL